MSFKQGDIVKFNFNPILGHEQGGYRPALVISAELFNKYTNQLIVCPITTQEKKFPTRILINNKDLKTQGYIICDHVKTIDIEARSPRFIEKADKETIAKVLDIIKAFLEEE